MSGTAEKVLLIGWDAADWKVIHPLMDAGRMPHLKRLVEGGAMANLATLHPVLSPMLWMSIATGKRPYKHGVLGFSEPTPDGGAVQPVSSLSRNTKALWNILNQVGKRSIVVGWWPSHPVEPINGAMVSNHYQTAVGPPGTPWPVPPGMVHPASLAEPLAGLRVNPNELTPEEILPFVPKALEIDQQKDRRLAGVMKNVAECACINNAATWLMAEQDWDFCAIYFDAIDHFCHGFMKYHPPRQDWVNESDYELYKDVVNSAYCYHDIMLGAQLAQAGPDTTVIICSDHGFHPDHLRPRLLPDEPAGPAAEHRDLGMLLIAGPGIRPDSFVHGANMLDIAPTILTLYGLPVGADMDGRPLLQAFEQPPTVEYIPSWDAVPGDAAMHPPNAQYDPITASETLNQLVALGYIDPLEDNREQAVARTTRELRYNLARAYMDGDHHGEALGILRELYHEDPGQYRFGVQAALCLQALGETGEMRQLVEELIERRREDGKRARTRLRELAEELKERHERQQAKQGADDAADAPEARLLSDTERDEWRRLESLARVRAFDLDYLMGYVELADGNPELALKYLERAMQADATRPGLFIQTGEALLRIKHWGAAEDAFGKALLLDQLNSHAHLGLARSYLAQNKNKLAAEEALKTVGLLYHYPMAHYCLGLALLRLNRVSEGETALNTAVELNPNFQEAHERLARFYAKRKPEPDKAAMHRKLAQEIKQNRRQAGDDVPRAAAVKEPQAEAAASPEDMPPPVIRELDPARTLTVVAGLPRSGTSMMMQMLEIGGLPVLSDSKREADVDNPKGYFELEAVTRLRNDNTWLGDAVGKGVKIIAQLLPSLPVDLHYKVIFMERDLDEVLASQRAMLERLQRPQAKLAPDRLKQTYRRQLENVKVWLARQPNIHVLHIEHRQALDDPRGTAERVSTFLGGKLAVEMMADAVDPLLYRQRSGDDLVV